jgi:hypothetical protein
LFLQIAIDDAALPNGIIWPARIAALLAAPLVSGGFFGIAHTRALRGLPYTGALLPVGSTLVFKLESVVTGACLH